MKIQPVTSLTAIALALGAWLCPVQTQARVWYSSQHHTGAYAIEVLVHGSALPIHHLAGHGYVEGRMGERYEIRIHNHTWRRVEAVISVDGRDAIDGQSARLSRRGYIIPPHSHIDVDGFRINQSEVAAFRFTSVPDSYASRMGTPWKVGIVGVALFPERTYHRPRRPPYSLRDKRRIHPQQWDDGIGGAADEAKAAPSSRSSRNLGTQFGERRVSPVTETRFRRANWSSPAARLSLRYDDHAGLCNLGVGAFCYPIHPPYQPPYQPPYSPPPEPPYSQPPPGWDHFQPQY